MLDQILTEYPQLEVVQIQLNYVDFESPTVESRKCLEVCRKHGKSAIIMEPVKGGSLVNLPEEAQKIFDALGGGSNASYAIRFAASQEGVVMVLSGMGNMDMVLDNCGYMKDFQPLSAEEAAAVDAVCDVFYSQGVIACTACRYCTDVCPMGIDIPMLMGTYNELTVTKAMNAARRVEFLPEGKRPVDCIGCGACAAICPQSIDIPETLKALWQIYENMPKWAEICKKREEESLKLRNGK